jgi:hypothetical protein
MTLDPVVIFMIFVLGTVLGNLLSYRRHSRKFSKTLKQLRMKQAEEVMEARGQWYKYGHDDALNDPDLIKKTCNKFHHTHYV